MELHEYVKYIFYIGVAIIGFFFRDLLNSLKDSLKFLSGKVDSIEDQVTAARVQIDFLQKQLDEEKARIAALQTKINSDE